MQGVDEIKRDGEHDRDALGNNSAGNRSVGMVCYEYRRLGVVRSTTPEYERLSQRAPSGSRAEVCACWLRDGLAGTIQLHKIFCGAERHKTGKIKNRVRTSQRGLTLATNGLAILGCGLISHIPPIPHSFPIAMAWLPALGWCVGVALAP